jgi:hypothetical protein
MAGDASVPLFKTAKSPYRCEAILEKVAPSPHTLEAGKKNARGHNRSCALFTPTRRDTTQLSGGGPEVGGVVGVVVGGVVVSGGEAGLGDGCSFGIVEPGGVPGAGWPLLGFPFCWLPGC